MLDQEAPILTVRNHPNIALDRLFADIKFSDSEEQKEEWRRDPEKYRAYRKMVEEELNQRYKLVLRNSHESDEANAVSISSQNASVLH